MPLLSSAVLPVLLPVASNVFTTVAWYGHLKFPSIATERPLGIPVDA